MRIFCIYHLPEDLGMKKVVCGCTWYEAVKEPLNQGEYFLDFNGFAYSYAGPKSNLYPCMEISAILLLTLKSFIDMWNSPYHLVNSHRQLLS